MTKSLIKHSDNLINFEMKNLRFLCQNSNLWIYYAFCAFTILGLYIFGPKTAETQRDGESNFRTFAYVNYSLPTSDWIPVEFASLSRTKENDIIYVNKEKDSINIYSYSPDAQNYRLTYNNKFLSHKITQIYAFDFYQTGYNDLIITYSDSGNSPYQVAILKNENGVISEKLEKLPIETTNIPFPFNGNNTTPQLLFTPPYSIHTKSITNDLKITETQYKQYEYIGSARLFNANPNFIAMVAKSNSKFIEITDSNFNVINSFEIPADSSAFTIADFNRNGDVDILVTVTPEKGNPYLIIYFGNDGKFTSDGSKITTPKLSKSQTVSVGDVDLDGRPDIIFSNEIGTTVLLNQFCKGCQGGELFFSEMLTVPGYGGLFNSGEKGTYDIVTEKGYFLSNLTNDEMFLSITPLNDVCLENCKGSKHPNPQPISTTSYGSVTKAVYTDKNGQRHKAIGISKATLGLSSPQTIFGFGENLHYIQEVSVNYRTNLTWVLPNSFVYTTEKKQYKIVIGFQTKSYPVICSCTALLLILGFFVVYYTELEREEDRQEAEKMLPMF